MSPDMQKLRDAFVAAASAPDRISEADKWLTRLIPAEAEGTCRFCDLDYTVNLNSNWPTSQNLGRTRAFASAWYQTRLEKYLTAALSVLDDWLIHRYRNPNWWHMQIGIPLALTDIALLLWDVMGGERRAGVLEILDEGSFGAHPEYMEKWTGANLIWEAGTTIKVALLREDEELLRLAIDRLNEEIAFSNEGIQPDGSFFQHGRLLYSGGYGRSFISQLSELILPFSGTRYQFPKEKLDLILLHLLDGLRYMTHRDEMDGAISGREYTRAGGTNLRSLLPALDRLAATAEMPRKEEVRAYRDAIAERKTQPDLAAVKYFPVARFLTCRAGECFFAFKGAGNDTLCTEHCNEEGVLGYNLSYGTRTTAMRDAREYADIAPLWDYAAIPGTTAPAERDEELYAKRNDIRRPLASDVFGGGQIADCGYCYEEAVHDGVRALVCCFAIPGGLVLLGCDLNDEQGRELVTTVEQCHAKEDYRIEGGSVIHGGIRYRSLCPDEPLLPQIAKRTGNPVRNNRQKTDRGDLSGRIFSLTVDRAGKNHYAYAILPEEIDGAGIRVLQNDRRAQAIALPDGRVLAVCYTAGDHRFGGKECRTDGAGGVLL